LFVLLVVLIATPLCAQPRVPAKAPQQSMSTAAIDSGYKEIKWDELVPKDWDPAKKFRNMDLSRLTDFDPKAISMLEMLKQEWDNAPVNAQFDGSKVKIAGFVVPIEEKGRAVTEFLLVPYFGACIHVPPPPANQIIHVISAKPIPNLRTMDAVWVAGEIKTASYSRPTPMGLGNSGYQIRSVAVTPYQDPAMVTITPGR
jgi:hypothetical protein